MLPFLKSSKCQHLDGAVVETVIDGGYRGVCLTCRCFGPRENHREDAIESYYLMLFQEQQQEIQRLLRKLKENEMSQADYKRGVEDALTPITVSEGVWSVRGHDFPGDYTDPHAYIKLTDLRKIQEDRRKKLLTKKVTKWVNVYWLKHVQVVHTSQSTYDSPGAAIADYKVPDSGVEYLGATSIEINVPL